MATYEQWEGEPDYLTGSFYGLNCAVIRNEYLGNLCGYVAVKPGHPLYGVRYGSDHPMLRTINVHGGLTYSENNLPKSQDKNEGNQWWFGFDCGHYGDLVPQLNVSFKEIFGKEMPGKYKDIEYVKKEVEYLAKQLAGNAQKRLYVAKRTSLKELEPFPKLGKPYAADL